jgi:hypothetical protein
MRKLPAKLEAYIDDKLKGNGLAQHAIKTKNARQVAIEAAKSLVSIKEKTNKNDGEMVELIQSVSGGKRGHAWCMYLIMAAIAYAEKKTGVKSPIPSSGHCMTVWNRTPAEFRVKTLPLPGAIAIWRHGNTSSGHTGMVMGADGKVMNLVEGNTTSGKAGGTVVREGHGCYFTERSMQGFPNIKTTGSMKLVGFLVPFPKVKA